MTTMNAVAMNDSLPVTHPDALELVELPVPEPGENDLLVRVKAVSVNPVDVKIRAGAGRQPEPKVLGWDAAGVVERIGAAVTGFAVGDEVFYAGDLTRPGTNSDLHTVDHRIVGHKPTTLDFADAAGLPLTAITAWESLFDRMRLHAGSEGTLLVVGGAGGVGSLVIQLAKKLTRLRVVATASRPESIAWCKRMGADDTIDHTEDLAPQMERLGGADHVFSAYTVGRESDVAAAMRPQGHLVLIDDPETFDIGAFKSRSASVTPEFMFTRSMFVTDDIRAQGELLDEVSSMVDDGTLHSTTTRRLNGLTPQSLLEAHRLIETGHVVGKIVIDFAS